MPVPSFDELLSQAREIGRIKKEAGDFPRGELIAKSVSDFVNKLLFTQGQDRATYSSQLDPSTGKVTSLSTPQVSGRSLFEKMLGVQGYEGQPSGMVPLTSKDTSAFGMAAGLQNLKKENQETPVAVGYNEETGEAGEVFRGKPGEKLSVFGYGKKGSAGPDKVTLRREQEKLDNAISALSIISNLEKNFEKTESGARALGSRAASFLSMGTIGNEGQRVYDDSFNANAVKFYRAYTGDTRLSDADAKERALGILPGSSLEKSVGRIKFSEIRGNVLRDIAPILGRLGIPESKFLERVKGNDRIFKDSKVDDFESDVLAYAEKYKISPEEAQKIKLRRTGGK